MGANGIRLFWCLRHWLAGGVCGSGSDCPLVMSVGFSRVFGLLQTGFPQAFDIVLAGVFVLVREDGGPALQ